MTKRARGTAAFYRTVRATTKGAAVTLVMEKAEELGFSDLTLHEAGLQKNGLWFVALRGTKPVTTPD